MRGRARAVLLADDVRLRAVHRLEQRRNAQQQLVGIVLGVVHQPDAQAGERLGPRRERHVPPRRPERWIVYLQAHWHSSFSATVTLLSNAS